MLRPSVPKKQPTTLVRLLPFAGWSSLRHICRRPRRRRHFLTLANPIRIKFSQRSSLEAIDRNSERLRLPCGISQSASREKYSFTKESRKLYFVIQSSCRGAEGSRPDAIRRCRVRRVAQQPFSVQGMGICQMTWLVLRLGSELEKFNDQLESDRQFES